MFTDTVCVCGNIYRRDSNTLEKIVLFCASGKDKVADLALHADQEWGEVIVELEREKREQGERERGGLNKNDALRMLKP